MHINVMDHHHQQHISSSPPETSATNNPIHKTPPPPRRTLSTGGRNVPPPPISPHPSSHTSPSYRRQGSQLSPNNPNTNLATEDFLNGVETLINQSPITPRTQEGVMYNRQNPPPPPPRTPNSSSRDTLSESLVDLMKEAAKDLELRYSPASPRRSKPQHQQSTNLRASTGALPSSSAIFERDHQSPPQRRSSDFNSSIGSTSFDRNSSQRLPERRVSSGSNPSSYSTSFERRNTYSYERKDSSSPPKRRTSNSFHESASSLGNTKSFSPPPRKASFDSPFPPKRRSNSFHESASSLGNTKSFSQPPRKASFDMERSAALSGPNPQYNFDRRNTNHSSGNSDRVHILHEDITLPTFNNQYSRETDNSGDGSSRVIDDDDRSSEYSQDQLRGYHDGDNDRKNHFERLLDSLLCIFPRVEPLQWSTFCLLSVLCALP